MTAWVWSWGSRLREVSWRKVAATIFCPPSRTIRPVAGSFSRVSAAFLSIQASVAATARSCASTTRASPPTRPASDTDFGAERVTSRPGRCSMLPSLPRRPSARPEPSGTLPSSTPRKASGSTGTFEPERLGALAGPGAGLAVGGIVARVVAVLLVVGDALRGRADGADGGDHLRDGSGRRRRRPPEGRAAGSRGGVGTLFSSAGGGAAASSPGSARAGPGASSGSRAASFADPEPSLSRPGRGQPGPGAGFGGAGGSRLREELELALAEPAFRLLGKRVRRRELRAGPVSVRARRLLADPVFARLRRLARVRLARHEALGRCRAAHVLEADGGDRQAGRGT